MNSKWCCIDWHKKASENTKNKLSNNFQFVSIVMHWKTRVQFTVKQLNIDERGTKICCYYLLQTNFLTFCPRVDSKNISTSLIATLFFAVPLFVSRNCDCFSTNQIVCTRIASRARNEQMRMKLEKTVAASIGDEQMLKSANTLLSISHSLAKLRSVCRRSEIFFFFYFCCCHVSTVLFLLFL